MAEQEAKITVCRNFGGIRVDSVSELRSVVANLFGDDSWDAFVAELAKDYLPNGVTDAFKQAEQNLRDGGVVDQNQNSSQGTAGSGGNGQYKTVDQPGFNNQQQSSGPDVPPGVEYPGDCKHGNMKYYPKNQKVGARWECSVPWSKNAQGRCTTVWVKD